MEPIFSPQAQVVAWFKNDAIYDENGHPRAIVRDRCIYTLNGTYLRIKSETALGQGDYVAIGRKLMRVELNA